MKELVTDDFNPFEIAYDLYQEGYRYTSEKDRNWIWNNYQDPVAVLDCLRSEEEFHLFGNDLTKHLPLMHSLINPK